MKEASFVVTPEMIGRRLDFFLASQLGSECSRSKVKEFIQSGNVSVNGAVIQLAHYAVKENEKIQICYDIPTPPKLVGSKIPLEIVFEDKVLAVINKPAGLVVHPGAGARGKTLVNGLIYHFKNLSEVGGQVRPGIVHRIDKDTSGLLVIAKTDEGHRKLAEQFRDHSIRRIYHTFVRGVVQRDEGMCDAPIGKGKIFKRKMVISAGDSKEAITHFRVLKRFSKSSYLEVRLETGRTHQVRVHLAFLGYPLLGDDVYGVKSLLISRQALHAKVIGFHHPTTGKWMEFDSELPKDMQSLMRGLESEK